MTSLRRAECSVVREDRELSDSSHDHRDTSLARLTRDRPFRLGRVLLVRLLAEAFAALGVLNRAWGVIERPHVCLEHPPRAGMDVQA